MLLPPERHIYRINTWAAHVFLFSGFVDVLLYCRRRHKQSKVARTMKYGE